MSFTRTLGRTQFPALLGLAAGLVSCLGSSNDAGPSPPELDKAPLADCGDRPGDSLFIGDGGDDTVKRFDAATGAYRGTFVKPSHGRPHGPMGLIFDQRGGPNSDLLLANQNAGTSLPGEVLRYRRSDGAFRGALVASSNPHAPFGPRGMVLGKHHVLYVADLGNGSRPGPGRIARYDVRTGKFLGDLAPSGFTGNMRPRGLVTGPDGMLYASAVDNLEPTSPLFDPLSGWILRFDPERGTFVDVLASDRGAGCAADLHRPEGIVFGPDGNLYVTAFRASPADTDKVLVFDPDTGDCIDEIDLYRARNPPNDDDRAFAQDILFGPRGYLFVAITGGGPGNAGSVRRYDVESKTYRVLVRPSAAGGPLLAPYYMTFGNTDPATLDYEGPRGD